MRQTAHSPSASSSKSSLNPLLSQLRWDRFAFANGHQRAVPQVAVDEQLQGVGSRGHVGDAGLAGRRIDANQAGRRAGAESNRLTGGVDDAEEGERLAAR